MYKPPMNCNRVKSIKSKFENIENQARPVPTTSNTHLRNVIALRKNVPLTESSRNSQPCNKGSAPPCEASKHDHPLLTRQLSDPLKRNVKRTPAFRVDKNSGKTNETVTSQQIDSHQKTLFETKVKQFNSVKGCESRVEKRNKEFNTSIDNNATGALYVTSDSNSNTTNCDVSGNLLKQNTSFLHSANGNHNFDNLDNNPYKTDFQTVNKRPPLVKSKSSHDFQYIRNKFNKEALSPPTKPLYKNTNITNSATPTVENIPTNEDTDEALLLRNIDLSLLYTEPIPKSLRNKNSSESSSGNAESPLFKPKIENIYTKSTLQLTDSDKNKFLESLKKVLNQDLAGGLSDSLKVALKKPLPDGPAPKKPPRTFQHSAESIMETKIQKNNSFLHIAKEVLVERRNGIKKNGKCRDPKYMLNKLETALKNNKLKARKQQSVEASTTSGEDSDDSLLFRSKSYRNLPKPPTPFQDIKPNTTSSSNGLSDFLLGDLNCFTSLGCTNPAYERVQEPNSSFFVGNSKDPIYAEPIHNKVREGGLVKNNRNSLYYMSTALISEDTGQGGGAVNGSGTSNLENVDSKMDGFKGDIDNNVLKTQISVENSSLSSFTSDLDSNPSPVTTDDPHVKIRYLIDNFETRRQTLPKIERPKRDSRQERICSTPPDSSGRVEVLKNSLKKALDRSFNSDVGLASPRDSDSEKNEEGKVARMVERFHTFQKTAPKYQQPNINTGTLFYCCLVIEKVRDCAQIKFKFPPSVDIPRDIEQLCFPESPDSPPLEGTSAAQTYTLLITSETGDRTYGYCRRVLPEGSTYCLPLAYCILSKYKAPRFYKRILLELESRHGMQNKYRDELFSQFYHKKFPKRGESISINLSSIEGCRARDSALSYSSGLEDALDFTSCTQENKAELVLTLHPDPRYEDADLKRLHKLPPDILLKIFSSLLLERKVVLISSVISELSSCVDSLQSILYPFTWYHTFIPILPESLWDIVESPTPVVCGVLSEEAVQDRNIENGIVVNLDSRSVLVEEGDEMKILSSNLHKVWRQFITLANNTKSTEYVYSVYLADAYLYVFICCFKNYKQYVVDGQFRKDELVKNAKPKGVRRFLKMFTETCMFHAFMDAALNSPESLIAFDKKIELYGSDESRIILDKLIDWHR